MGPRFEYQGALKGRQNVALHRLQLVRPQGLHLDDAVVSEVFLVQGVKAWVQHHLAVVVPHQLSVVVIGYHIVI